MATEGYPPLKPGPHGSVPDLFADAESRGFESSESFETAIAEWDPPIEFDEFDVPPFPVEALPAVIGNYALELAKTHKVPVDIPACAELAALSASVARKAEVEIGDTHRESLNLYFAPSAGSGERKKVIRAPLEPLYEVELDLRAEAAPRIAEATSRLRVAEERINKLEKSAAKEEDPGEARQSYERDHVPP